MKRIFRWAIGLFLALVLLVITVVLFRETIVREFAEFQFKKQTGFEARIGRLHVGYREPVLRIENLVIYNPPAFGGGPFIKLPELQVEYDRDALRAGKLHCKLVRFNLAEVNLVEDANGGHNFELFQKRLYGRLSQARPPGSGSKIQFDGIDTLNLTLGKATYLRMKQPDKVEELRLNVDHQDFTNIKSNDDLNGVLMVVLLRSGVNLMQNGNSQSWLQLFAPLKK